PAACSARMADSRPAPGPFTYTSICRMPLSIAFLPATSPARVAANGVLLRDPLKPWSPALAQTTVFPPRSVMVTMVLLKEAWMWATPLWTIFFSRFLPFFTPMPLLSHPPTPAPPGRGLFPRTRPIDPLHSQSKGCPARQDGTFSRVSRP